ncbi:FlgD immunoglobulin-like domain containing protein [Treponema sp. HNW]|uniref:FlgD immunoglobulin-like domain containing protein n=1 Tax=Treponema sp. HNW TaxID=3116654 RepID=UPI003D09F145
MVKGFKSLFTISVILLSMTAGWAATKTWVGGDLTKPTDWDTPGNWTPAGVPNAGDNVIINSGVNQPVIENHLPGTKKVEIHSIEVKTGATLKIIAKQRNIEFIGTSNFLISGQIVLELREGTVRYVKISNTDFTGSPKILIDSPLTPLINSAYHTKLEASGNIHFKQASTITADNYANDDKLIINSPKTTIAGSFTVDSKLEIGNSSGVLLDITGTFTAKRSVNITDSANTIIRSSVEQSDGTLLGGTVNLTENLTLNNATWTTSKGEVKTKGDFEVPNFKQTGGTLKLEGTSTQNLKIDKAHNLTFTGNVNLEGNLKISGNFTNKGTFDATTSPGYTVTLTHDANHTITGTNTAGNTKFHTLELINAGGKTLTINGKITADDLNISGTPSNKLTVQGVGTSSEITLTSDQIPDPVSKKGYYLKVNTNISVTDGHTFYIANSELVEPKSSNWKSMASTWKTTTGSDNWNVPANWTPAAVPAADWPVIIPAGGSGATYPKLNPTTLLNPAAQASSVTVETGAKLDLGAEIIQDSGAGSAVTAHITNNGILKMIGTTGNSSNPGQKEWLEITSNYDNITHGPGSTIEYYGASPANPTIWEGPYQNLRVGDAKTGLNTGSLVVNGYFTVDTTGGFTVNAASQSYAELVTLHQQTTFNSTDGTGTGTVFNGGLMTNNRYIFFGGAGRIQTHDIYGGSEDITLNAGTGTWTSSGDIQARDITVNAGTGAWTSSGGTINARDIVVKRDWTSNGFVRAAGNITADNASHDNTWTAGDVTLKGSLTAAQFNQTSGTLTFNGTGTPEQELKFTGAGNKNIRNLTVDNGITPPASNAKVKLLSPVMIAGNFTNKGTFNANSKDISLDGSFTNSGIFNTGTGNSLVFNSTFTNNGTFNADAGTIVFTGNAFTNSGTFIAGTNNTVNLSPSGDIAITGTGIAGNTKFHTLKLTNAGGKTLTINGKVSVNGNLTLEGSGSLDAQLLTVQGGTNSPGIQLNIDKSGGKWLKVHTNIPMIPESGGHTYTVTESKAEEIPGFPLSGGHPKNWIFTGYAGTLTWKGNHSSNWNDWQNWRPYGTPGVNSVVIIEKKPTTPPPTHYYPKLTGNVSAKTVTVNPGAELDLDGHIIQDGEAGSAVTAHIANNGILKMIGTTTGNPFNPGQKEWLEINNSGPNNNITHGSGSTVEYYGTSTANVWEGPYQKLKISGSRNDLRAVSLTVDQYLITDHDGVTITTTNGQTYHGNVIAFEEVSSSPPTYTYYDLTLTNTGTGTIKTSRGVTTGHLTVNGKWEAGDQNNSATVEVNGNITVSGDIASVGSSIMAKKVSGSGGNITVNGAKDWRCWGNITAEGDMTIHNMTATGGTIAVHGNMTAHTFHLADYGKLYFNGSSPQNLNFTDPAGSQIRELEIGSSSTLNLGSSIKITHILTNKGRFTAGNHTVTLSKADRIDNSDPNTVPPTSITITGTSTAGDTEFEDLICTDSYIKRLTINKNISVTGSLKLQGQSAASPLTVAGGTSVGTGSPHIALTAANTAKGQFLNVETDIAITGGPPVNPYTYTAENSIPIGSDSDIQAGKPDNWIFTNYSGDISWAGTVDSDWHNRRNWNPPYAIPGKDTVVTIPRKPSPAPPSHDYPKLTKAGEAKSITIDEKASLDLAGFVITKGAGADNFTPLTNNGTLKMTGTTYPSPAPLGGQKEWLASTNVANKITHENKSAIEYYGTSADVVWKGPYKNLILNIRPDLNIQNENLVVEKKLTITGSPAHINTGTGTQTYQGEIDAKKSAVPHWNIEFTASSLTMEKGTDTLNINAEDIKVNAGTWTSSANINAASITASGSWTTKKGNINLRGGLSAGSFEQEKGTLTLGGSGDTLKYTLPSGKAKIKNLIIASSATVNLGSDITITEMFENNGTFNAVTNTVYLKHSESPVVIKGNGDKSKTQFRNLVCTGAGGKSIRFENKISVYGDLTLQGTAKTNLLNISGTSNNAEIYVNQDKNTGTGSVCKWLGVAVNLPLKSLDTNIYTCTTDESEPTGSLDDIIAGKPENWIFDNVYKLRWTGEANDNDWNNPNNWRPRPSHAPKATQAVTVREVAGDKHPILGSGTYYAEKVEVVGTASLDLADKLIYKDTASPPVTMAKLENKGTLKLKGTDDQKLWFEQTVEENKMTVTQSSTVEYYGTSPATINLWGGGTEGYKNLILNNILSCTIQNTPLKVNGDLTVKGSDVTIDSGTASQTYGGKIDAHDSGNRRAVTLKGSDINVNNASAVITAEKFTVDGNFTFQGPTITAAEQTYTKTVHFDNIDLQASSFINFENSVTCSRNLTLSSGTGTLTVGKAGGTSVTISADEQSYAGPLTLNVPVIFNTPGALTFKENISGTGSLTVPQNGPVYIAGNIALTGSSSEFKQTGSGTVLLSAGIQTKNGIVFAGPLYINNASVFNAGTGKNVTAKNVFVAAHDGTTNKTVELQSPLETDNFVLFSGNIKLSSGQSTPDISANKDIVLFGPDYNGDYTPPSGAADTTLVSNLFTYNHTSRPAPTITLPNNLPDTGNTAIQKNKGTFDLPSLGGKKLKATRNFYANGMNLCASSPWTLEISEHDSSENGFTEAYNTIVKNAKAEGGTVAAAEGCDYKLSGDPANTADTNSNWDFERPTIQRAYTVWDDVIFVQFSEPIENSRNEISAAVSRIKLNDGADINVSVWKNKECTDSTEGAGDLQSFYLKASAPWNTDATGSSPGVGQSTDMGRADITPGHRSIKPNINIATVVSSLYETLRDKNKNRITDYSGINRFTAVQDNCPPVLIGVYTGQEMHTPHNGSGTGGQPEYDAHNFIEFRYSEPVNIYENTTDGAAIALSDSAVNIRSTNTLGNIGPNGSGLKIAGFADIASGSLSAASRDGGIPHALYRNFPAAHGSAAAAQTHRVRISIAGFADGTKTVGAYTVHNWVGYIDNAVTPSGNAVPPGNDKFAENGLIRSAAVFDPDGTGPLPAKPVFSVKGEYVPIVNTALNVPLDTGNLHGSWDTSAPVFARYAKDEPGWISSSLNEIIGFAPSNIVEKLEFHFFDNAPSYTAGETFRWQSTDGVNEPAWFQGASTISNTSYDKLGGSRFDPNGTAPTEGGIRASSLSGSIGAFSFRKKGSSGALIGFTGGDTDIRQKADSGLLFRPIPSGRNPVDTLYLQLDIQGAPALALPITQAFSVEYDQSVGFVTDLAGNRMRTQSAESIDLTRPRIVLSIAPVGTDKVYILFNTPINTDAAHLAGIPHNLEIPGSANSFDPLKPAQVRTLTDSGTGLILHLSNRIVYSDIKKPIRIRVSSASSPPNKMFIERTTLNLAPVIGPAHALSDFAVNVVRPLYVHDDGPGGEEGFQSLASGLAMRLFDGSGGPGNTAFADKDLTIAAARENGDADKLQMYYDTDPRPESVSVAFNLATGLKSRVWLPKRLDAISFAANSSAPPPLDMTLSGASSVFSNPGQPLNFPPDKTVEFLFGLQEDDGSGGFQDVTIDHDADGTTATPTPEVPLYALRLKDPNDPASIDLWSFNTSALKPQVGGVSILNNVINTTERENVVIQVKTEKAGSLSVMVMTLDGDVVKVLHSGRVEKGSHLYRWNGTNKSGTPVARGMYFIRVIGPGIDETRKVMAVKE